MQTNENEFPITGREGGPIDLKTAAEWTKNYRQRNPDETISHFFGRNVLKEILDKPECMGIRIYYANSEKLGIFQLILISISNFFRKRVINTDGVKHLVFFGVSPDGSDRLLEGRDMSPPCPGPGCPPTGNDVTG